ncbi:HAD hydrolase-like protein [Rhodobacteraceae bacterium KMM 6894]|nr:HAD hydrolase-like protein [Rhodobacteraceae bacterium KMM 6894]
MFSTDQIFQRYQQVRARMPQAVTTAGMVDIGDLTQIADQADAFVFDAFGVLNVGETPIPGASDRLDQLRNLGCQIRILTNAASYDRAGAVAKFKRLGMQVLADEIITSRDATLNALTPGRWGVIAASGDTLSDLNVEVARLTDDASDYDAVDGFVFLSAAEWTSERQALLASSLAHHDRPVLIANADLAAPRDDGFSHEPGFFGHLLIDGGAGAVRFFGKPFAEVYDLTEATLPGIAPDRIVMCGDTLHTDIMGAAARGWRTVLVTQDGLFAGHDTESYCAQAGLFPDWRLARI